jgi:hypothetical protein
MLIDVRLAGVHEVVDEFVVTEHDAGHLGEKLVAVAADVIHVVHEAGNQLAVSRGQLGAVSVLK